MRARCGGNDGMVYGGHAVCVLIGSPYLLSGAKSTFGTDTERRAHVAQTADVAAARLDHKRCARRMAVARRRIAKATVAALDGHVVVCAERGVNVFIIMCACNTLNRSSFDSLEEFIFIFGKQN